MPEYEILACEKVKDLPDAKFGPAKVLKLRLKNGDGKEADAEWFTKAETPEPMVGSKEEFEIEKDPKYGLKAKRPGRGGGGAGGGGGMSPAREKRIVRQHSQQMALRLASILGTVPAEEEFISLINWFEADAHGKLKTGVATWPTNSDVPIDTSDFEPQPAPPQPSKVDGAKDPDDDIPF